MVRSPAARYAIALASAALAVAARVALNPLLGHSALLVTVFVAGVVLAWFYGRGPALVALAAGAAGTATFLLPPIPSIAVHTPADQITLASFLVAGVLTVLLVDSTQRARRRALLSAERALRDRGLLERVTDSTSVMLSQCSRELRYLFANRACAEFLGLPVDRIVGQDVRSVLGEPGFEAIRPYVERVLQGEAVEFETWVAHSSGPRFMRAQYVPDRAPDGGVRGFLASISDVTEQ